MIKKDDYHDNEYYKKFFVQKNKIKETYPSSLFYIPISGKQQPYTKEEQQMYKEYIKELADLMFKPKGWFQKFTWDIMSDSDKDEMERKTRGNNQGNRKSDFNYY